MGASFLKALCQKVSKVCTSRDTHERLVHIEAKLDQSLRGSGDEAQERLMHIEEKLDRLLPPHGAASRHENPNQFWGGYSYAQQGDDFVVINIMRNLGCERFTYLDLGAHHPWDISNTALFYENGCRGVNIEANPNLIRLFDKYRPEDTNANVGVGTKAGKMPFYMIDECSGRNSFLKAHVEAFVRENPQFQITQVIDVPVMTPMGIIEEYCHGEWPDFVSIDVEGLDYDILAAADFSKSAPLVIDVETDRDDVAPITALMKERGYVPVFKCRGDMIFVRKEDRYQAVLGEVWQSCRPKKEG